MLINGICYVIVCNFEKLKYQAKPFSRFGLVFMVITDQKQPGNK